MPLLLKNNQKTAFFSFVKNGTPLTDKDAPLCGMTLRAAGSMKFRWNEENPLRDETLRKIADGASIVPVQLDHTHIIYEVTSPEQTFEKIGDGIISTTSGLMPVVTVADCMPIWIYDGNSRVYGVLHSGWKGTGIVADAIKLAEKNFGAKAEDFCVILGPHIHDCCYIVNEERADYFIQNFGENCVKPLEEVGQCYCGGKGLPITWNNGTGKLYRLSLLQANLNALEKAGVSKDNINVIDECTCCNDVFGSNRRETASGQTFTVQAAFIKK